MSLFTIKSAITLDDYNWIIRDPISNQITTPVLLFNPTFKNPFHHEIDILNDDRMYQARVIDHFNLLLSEKWLYKKPIFKRLLKYFQVSKKGDSGKVQFITDPDNIPKTQHSPEDEKYIFRFIEKYIITRNFVDKVLREYVAITRIKWYDLFRNTDTLVDLFAHKLKKTIVSLIYEIQK